MTDTDGTITLERREQVTILTLRRPRRRNALNLAMWDALEATLSDLAGDPARCLIVTGEGEAFCSGFDIRLDNPITETLFASMQQGDRGPIHQAIARMKGILASIAALPMPTVAAINGKALGGGVELALACDLRLCDEQATLCMAETRIGLIPDLGGTVRLTRLLGPSRALDLIATARDVRADEALALGLVDRVAPTGKALDLALDLAALIAQNGPRAVRLVKTVIRGMADLDAALEAETEAAVDAVLSGEAVEGITAWMQKRPAQFKDPV